MAHAEKRKRESHDAQHGEPSSSQEGQKKKHKKTEHEATTGKGEKTPKKEEKTPKKDGDKKKKEKKEKKKEKE